jgi:hypothetical protein
MPFKDILHRHGKDQSQHTTTTNSSQEFTFIRTDTHTQEILTPAAINTSIANTAGAEESHSPTTPTTPRRKSFFRRRSHIPSSDNTNNLSSPPRSGSEKGEKRISNLLHLDHHSRTSLSRSGSTSSVNIPADLPQIDAENVVDEQDREAQWEKRATRLVQGNPRIGGVSPDRISQSAGSTGTGTVNFSYLQPNQGQQRSRSRSSSGVSEPQADVSFFLQEPLGDMGDADWDRLIYKKRFDFMRMGVCHINHRCDISDYLCMYRTRKIDAVIRHPRRPQRLQQRHSPSPLRPRTPVSLPLPIHSSIFNSLQSRLGLHPRPPQSRNLPVCSSYKLSLHRNSSA